MKYEAQLLLFFAVLLLSACPDNTDPAVRTDAGFDTEIVSDAELDLPTDADIDIVSDLYDPTEHGTYFKTTCVDSPEGFIRISHENAQTTGSFQLVVWSPTRDPVSITEVRLPNSSTLNINGLNEFQVRDDDSVRAFTIPGIESLRDQLMVGTYQFRVTVPNRACFYVAENPDLGDTIDLNFWYATARFDAAEGQNDPDWLITFDLLRDQLRLAGLEIGNVTYQDIDPAVARNYHVLQTEEQCRDLFSLPPLPEGANAANSVNVFLVDEFTWISALGTVHGVNSPVGLYGTANSGFAVSLRPLGLEDIELNSGAIVNGNKIFAGYIAHELGHFLGLRHTSETGLRDFDPLDDTPQCTPPFDILTCADAGNLMFPGTKDDLPRTVTPQQIEMLRLHPSVK